MTEKTLPLQSVSELLTTYPNFNIGTFTVRFGQRVLFLSFIENDGDPGLFMKALYEGKVSMFELIEMVRAYPNFSIGVGESAMASLYVLDRRVNNVKRTESGLSAQMVHFMGLCDAFKTYLDKTDTRSLRERILAYLPKLEERPEPEQPTPPTEESTEVVTRATSEEQNDDN